MNTAKASLASIVQRSITKSQAIYKNTGWDLVDAVKEGSIDLEEVKNEDLPAEMKSLSLNNQKQYLETKRAECEKIQKRINDLRQKRADYIVAE